MNYETLKTLTDADPVDASVLATLKSVHDTHRKITLGQVYSLMIDQGTLSPITSAAAEANRLLNLDPPGSPSPAQGAALQAVSLLRGAALYRESVNWSKASHVAVIDNLVAVGLLTQAQRDAIYDAAPVETEYVYEHLGLPEIDDASWLYHIEQARAL